MANVRPDKIPGVFANAGTTTIPGTPVTGTTYRDTALSQATVEDGWPYNEIVNSADFNQILYLYSSLLADIDAWGIAGWSDQVDYAAGAWARGSDGVSYRATAASGPATAAEDPTDILNRPDFWQSFDEILKAVNLVWSPDVNYVHPTLAFGSDDQLYVSLQDSGPSGVGAQDPVSEPTFWEVFGARGLVSPWDSGVDYTNPVRVYGSDDRLYISQQDSGPSGVGAQDPTTDDGTYWRVLDNSFVYNYLEVQHTETSGTNGATLTAATWTNRPLNTLVTNGISGASVNTSTYEVTLPAGDYEIDCDAVLHNPEFYRTRLRNITDAADTLLSLSGNGTPDSVNYPTKLLGRFTIAATKTFTVDHIVSAGSGTNTLGTAGSFGTEIYAIVRIRKIK